jgi:anthraniloyl-CoA monooxygenase
VEFVNVGGGPAGLYFAILTKLRDPGADVTVLERNPAGVTFGWGVTFSDDVLDGLYRGDPVSAAEIQRNPASWTNQVVRLGDQPVAHLGGYGFAIGRHRLLELLAERATALGVRIRYEFPVDDPAALAEFASADLVLAADGANSRLRGWHAEEFGTASEQGENYYIWLGAAKVFPEFEYTFVSTEAGWIWFYAYPFDEKTTTFIAECGPRTWQALGFDALQPAECLKTLQEIFAKHLDGKPLLIQTKGGEDASQPAPWARFNWVTSQAWHHGNVVLAGDAAHTTHFSIGNGTKLAFDDVLELDRQLAAHPGDIPAALVAYQRERVAAVGARQQVARNSSRWFEQVDRFTGLAPTTFSYALRTRGDASRPAPSGPGWLVHRATQLSLGRTLRGMISSSKRRQRARGHQAEPSPHAE